MGDGSLLGILSMGGLIYGGRDTGIIWRQRG